LPLVAFRGLRSTARQRCLMAAPLFFLSFAKSFGFCSTMNDSGGLDGWIKGPGVKGPYTRLTCSFRSEERYRQVMGGHSLYLRVLRVQETGERRHLTRPSNYLESTADQPPQATRIHTQCIIFRVLFSGYRWRNTQKSALSLLCCPFLFLFYRVALVAHRGGLTRRQKYD